MKTLFLILNALIALSNQAFAIIDVSKIDCKNFKESSIIGNILHKVRSKNFGDFKVHFSVSTIKKKHTYGLMSLWSGLRSSEFDPSKKTYLIIHGYKSGGDKDWVLDLKDAIIKTVSLKKV